MHRERKRHLPSVPKTLERLGISLHDYKLTRDIYKGTVVATDGSVHILLASNEGINLLNRSSEIFADGTFKARHFHINHAKLKISLSYSPISS